VTAPEPEVVTDPRQRRDLGIEIILLLGVSLAASGVNAVLVILLSAIAGYRFLG
jgi:hypothetical protein